MRAILSTFACLSPAGAGQAQVNLRQFPGFPGWPGDDSSGGGGDDSGGGGFPGMPGGSGDDSGGGGFPGMPGGSGGGGGAPPPSPAPGDDSSGGGGFPGMPGGSGDDSGGGGFPGMPGGGGDDSGGGGFPGMPGGGGGGGFPGMPNLPAVPTEREMFCGFSRFKECCTCAEGCCTRWSEEQRNILSQEHMDGQAVHCSNFAGRQEYSWDCQDPNAVFTPPSGCTEDELSATCLTNVRTMNQFGFNPPLEEAPCHQDSGISGNPQPAAGGCSAAPSSPAAGGGGAPPAQPAAGGGGAPPPSSAAGGGGPGTVHVWARIQVESAAAQLVTASELQTEIVEAFQEQAGDGEAPSIIVEAFEEPHLAAPGEVEARGGEEGGSGEEETTQPAAGEEDGGSGGGGGGGGVGVGSILFVLCLLVAVGAAGFFLGQQQKAAELAQPEKVYGIELERTESRQSAGGGN